MEKYTVKLLTSPFNKQMFATMAATLFAVSCGAGVGFSAILLPQLKTTKNFMNISQETQSWIAAVVPLAIWIGTPFTGMIAARCGRKKSHQYIAVPMSLGWLIVTISNEPYLMIFGRLLAGIGMGLCLPVTAMFIGELSSPRYREFFLSWIALGLTGGVCLSHLLGTYLYWRTVSAIMAGFPIAGGILFLFLSDTPSWLITKSRFDEAKEAFRYYRGASLTKLAEVQPMIDQKITEIARESENLQHTTSFRDVWANMRKPEFYKPLIILVLFCLMLQFSTAMALAFYPVQIFGEILHGEVSEYTLMLSLDGVKFCSAIIACGALKHYKRRTVLLISGLSTSISMIIFIIWIHLKNLDIIPSSYNAIPLTLLVIHVVALCLGIIPLPYSLMGEIFPLNTRNLGASLCSIISSLLLFISSKSAPTVFSSLGMLGFLACSAMSTLIITILLLFLLPETKGKTLYQIEETFKGTRSDDAIQS